MILTSLLSDPVATAANQAASSSNASQDSAADAQFNGILSNLSSSDAGSQNENQARADGIGQNGFIGGAPGSATMTSALKSSAGAAAAAATAAAPQKTPASLLIMLQQAAGTSSAEAATPLATETVPSQATAASASSTSSVFAALTANAGASLAADGTAAAGTIVQNGTTPPGNLSAALNAMASAVDNVSNGSKSTLAAKVSAANQNQASSASQTTQDTGMVPQVAALLASMLGLSQTAPALTKTPSSSASSSSSMSLSSMSSPSPRSAQASMADANGTGQATASAGAVSTAQGIAGLSAATSQNAGGQPENGEGQSLPGQVFAAQAGTVSNAASAAQATDASATSSSTAHGSSASAADMSMVKSVSVETQLAPAPSLAPMLQVIDTVQKLAASEGASSTIDTPAAAVTSSAPVRSMTLVLEPENMGTVTVTMQMRGNSLDLQLDVANPQTLALLNKDRDSLTAAMSSQDYAVGSLTMRPSDVQNASSGTNDGSQTQSQGNSGQGTSYSSGNGTSNGGASQNGGSYGGRAPDSGADRSPVALVDGDPANSSGTSGVYI